MWISLPRDSLPNCNCSTAGSGTQKHWQRMPLPQTWRGGELGYAHPPWCLIGKVLTKALQEQAILILITPLWKGQSWFPVLTTMLVDYPILLPNSAEVLLPSPNCDCPIRQLQVQLVAWEVSGDISRQEEFLKGLSPLSPPHGER